MGIMPIPPVPIPHEEPLRNAKNAWLSATPLAPRLQPSHGVKLKELIRRHHCAVVLQAPT